MHCASCAAIITKKLKKIDGVKSADVNFATEKARVDFDASVSIDTLNQSIAEVGYRLVPGTPAAAAPMKGMDHSEHMGLGQSDSAKARELRDLQAKTQFVMPVALMVFVLMMWDIAAQTFPWMPNLPIPMPLFNIISMILATVVMFWIGQPFLLGVTRFIQYRVANMDTLIGIGTLTAYIYSSILVLLPQVRNLLRVPEYTYFDVAIVVIGFVILGKYLEARSKQRTGEAIRKLMNLQAKTALVVRSGKEVEIPVSEVQIDDQVIVKPGAKIPVDGVIIEGSTSIDESMVTGESMPADKKAGDTVIGATMNKQGSFVFRATKVGSDTLLSHIIKLVEEAQGSRAPIQALADKISSVFVPVVLGLAVLAFVLWLVFGIPVLGQSQAISYAILSFVGILVIACPCALGLATPTAIIVGVGKGAEQGILVKDAESLQHLSTVTTVVFDKTGTITTGVPVVTDVAPLGNARPADVMSVAASLEKKSEHPLAEAIVTYASAQAIEFRSVDGFAAMEGVGVKGTVDGQSVVVRKPSSADKLADRERLQREGKTVVVVEVGGTAIGLIAVSDTLKPGAKEAVAMLKKQGIKAVLLTGDNELAANFMAKQAGIDTVYADVLPQEKSAKIMELKNSGERVVMAGDGINDAPALAAATVGIAMATGTDIAIESAGITLLHGDIKKIAEAITLSRRTMRTVKQNLFWAFIFNMVGIPLAGGALYPIIGWLLNPVFAGLAMAFSSVLVVSNSLRLKVTRL